MGEINDDDTRRARPLRPLRKLDGEPVLVTYNEHDAILGRVPFVTGGIFHVPRRYIEADDLEGDDDGE